MKKIFFYLFVAIVVWSCNPKHEEKKENESEQLPLYDSVLVQKYGSDDFGMKQYVMAFLKRGPNRSDDSAEIARLQKAHLENIVRLAEEGKLLLAGPFIDDGDIRGIYIFDVRTIEEAQKLTETDPAIQEGSLEMELRPWYGSAAVMAIPEIHKKLEKISIID